MNGYDDEDMPVSGRPEDEIRDSSRRMMHAVRLKGREASERMQHYMHEYPVRTIVIAAVAGAAVGVMMASMRRRER